MVHSIFFLGAVQEDRASLVQEASDCLSSSSFGGSGSCSQFRIEESINIISAFLIYRMKFSHEWLMTFLGVSWFGQELGDFIPRRCRLNRFPFHQSVTSALVMTSLTFREVFVNCLVLPAIVACSLDGGL